MLPVTVRVTMYIFLFIEKQITAAVSHLAKNAADAFCKHALGGITTVFCNRSPRPGL